MLIIGTGIAGLTTAYALARAGIKVLLVTQAVDPADCNTSWAQGGIIYKGTGDSARKLADDIIRAGAGLCRREAVEVTVREGPERMSAGCSPYAASSSTGRARIGST